MGSFCRLLGDKVNPGDSVAQIEESLGKAIHLERQDSQQQSRFVSKGLEIHPELFPDGLEDSDVFVLYPCKEGGSIDLQIRDGRLINFDSAHYKDFEVRMIQPIGP